MKPKYHPPVPLPALEDGDCPLDQLLAWLPRLQQKYGKKARLQFEIEDDSGDLSLRLSLLPTKKPRN